MIFFPYRYYTFLYLSLYDREMKHHYNRKPDKKDHRDHMMKLDPPDFGLAKKVDLRDNCPPILNQGELGSCTGHAIGGLIEYLELQELKNKTPQDPEPQELSPGSFSRASRLFIYYNERLLEGTTDEDAGAQIRDGIKSLAKWGVCKEDLWDYFPQNAFTKPTDEAYKEAEAHKITSYDRIVTLDQMRTCLSQGYPFVLGISVYESFESEAVAMTGIVPMPGEDEKLLGGHAVMCVGYDDDRRVLIVRNSWGENWGDKGYFVLSYDFVQNPNLSEDFWVVKR